MKLSMMILVLLIMCKGLDAQQPVPQEAPASSSKKLDQEYESMRGQSQVPDIAGKYFVGATQNDKEFIDAVMNEAQRRGIRGFRKWRLQRRLNQANFVRAAKAEIAAQLYWENPEAFAEHYGVSGIDWSSIDWDQVFSIIMQLIEIFVKLFAEGPAR